MSLSDDELPGVEATTYWRRPMDCAGRAKRRRRFGQSVLFAEWTACPDPGSSNIDRAIPKRCRASLATAVQNGRVTSLGCNTPKFFAFTSRIPRYHSDMGNSASPTINLDDSNFDKEVTQSNQTVLVDFWAPWCGPCKMIAPLLDEIATEKAGTVKVAKVNVDENQSLSVKYNVRAIPALLFFKNGQLRDQVVGMTTRKDLIGRLDALA